MRGSIRKLLVVGTLASASLLFPGCADTNWEMDTGVQDPMGTGGSGGAGMEDTGTGGSGTGGAGGAHKGTHGGGTMARDAGTPGPADAGTGGAGTEGLDEQSGGLPTK